MKYKKILLTGASGELGKAMIDSSLFSSLLIPLKAELDITKPDTIKKFVDNNDFDAVVHCAALARRKECEENPIKAIETNIVGTSNLVNHIIEKEEISGKKIRFIHISTDVVYPGTSGNYSEKDETIPYNLYGWTKLGAECSIHALSNFCIIRTSFFDPKTIEFDDAAIDAYSSKVPVNYFIQSVSLLLNSSFVGTINVGRERRSDLEHYKEFKPDIKKCNLADIQKTVPFKLYVDSSMDISLWKKTEAKWKKKIEG
jgi:dTDP-4-dehydrorhamnose reductase